MMAEPTIWPLTVIRLPFAWPGSTACTTAVKASGKRKPVKTVNNITRDSAGRNSRSKENRASRAATGT
jgi:hypothetical protein